MSLNSYLHHLTATAACLLSLAIPIPFAQADDVDNLIETILDSSPSARAGAESYAAQAAKRNSTPKTLKKNAPKTADPKPTIPVLQIPEEDLLEVGAKFPKNIIGKYVYGPVTIDDFQIYEWDDSAFIGFFAKNLRTFYFETRDPLVIEKLSHLRRGMKFFIPKEFPLRVDVAGFFTRYGLHLPSENFLPEKEYLRQKQNKNNN
jgi:hypothetical protein